MPTYYLFKNVPNQLKVEWWEGGWYESDVKYQYIQLLLVLVPVIFDVNTLQGMNDAVLQLWSREMKIMQIK